VLHKEGFMRKSFTRSTRRAPSSKVHNLRSGGTPRLWRCSERVHAVRRRCCSDTREYLYKLWAIQSGNEEGFMRGSSRAWAIVAICPIVIALNIAAKQGNTCISNGQCSQAMKRGLCVEALVHAKSCNLCHGSHQTMRCISMKN